MRLPIPVFTQVQWILFIALVAVILNQTLQVIQNKAYTSDSGIEGFEDKKEGDEALLTWITDPKEIQDSYQAKVQDQLSQGLARTKTKVDTAIALWSNDKTPPSSWSVLDAGCGTGLSAIALAKAGVGNIIAIDQSAAMIEHAKDVLIPESTLTDAQKNHIHWRVDTLLNPSACSPAEVKHIICYYFTIQYLEDKESFFRNAQLWTQEGGTLSVEVVNKHKFDPVLESANPILGFSIQKQFKDRLRTSKVVFDDGEQESEFVLLDPKAEFRETFRFKNTKVRRQKHIFQMEDVKDIVKIAIATGWKYQGFQDLKASGFEQGYILMFQK